MRTPSPFLRAGLVALLISPSLAPVQAAAQVVNAAALSGGSAVSAVSAAAVRAPLSIGAMPLLAPSLSINNLSATPNIVPSLAPSALSAAPAASLAVPALEAVPAARAAAVLPSHPAAADGPTPLQEPLRPGSRSAHADPRMADGDAMVHDGPRGRWLVPLSSFEEPLAPVDWNSTRSRLNHAFDGDSSAAASIGDAPVAAGLSSLSAASTLERAGAAASIAKVAPPAAAAMPKRSGMSFAVKALIAAAILLATPAIALAAPVAGPIVITAASSLSFLASIQPLAAAAGAVGGAIYGMFAARSTDGTPTSAGEVFASILRYGVMGGAGAYILLDMTQIAFLGTSAIGLQPLTSAIAIAALGRTAFQDKFTDPATTSADRVMGAFPAVAAAVGISVGVAMGALIAPALAFTIATTAMAATGVATALYAAIFKPGQSLANGPARMAKGYVLQSLMMGLALAVQSNPYLFWPFALLGSAGFALVLWTTALEIWAHRPGAPAQPLPPAPPVKTPPATPTPAPKV